MSGFKYIVALEDCSFNEIYDSEVVGEFDSPDPAFDLNDEIQQQINDSDDFKYNGCPFTHVDVRVERREA